MKFKRILSIVMAAATFATSCQMVFAAKETVTENTREAELMMGLGLMSADENGDFHSDSPFTRAEMAELLVNIVEYANRYDTLGGNGTFSEKYDAWKFFEGASDYTSYIGEKLAKWEQENASTAGDETGNTTSSDKQDKFSIKYYDDVEANSSSCEAINKVTYYGIMNGYEDGKFRPTEFMTSLEAAASVINLLGYRATIPSLGGWPKGYMTVADNLKLKVDGSNKTVTRGEVAKLIASALNTNLMKYKIVGSDVTFSDDNNTTILSEYMTLTKIEGRVLQNGQTSLSGRSTLGSNGLQVGDKILFVNEKTDYAQEFIGRNVECYYFNDETDRENEVVYVACKNNEEVTFDIDDYLSYIGNEMRYESNGRERKSKLVDNPRYIYNGLAVTSCPESFFDSEQGSVTLVSADNSSVYDLIIIESYKSWFLTRAYESDEKFTIVNALSSADVMEFEIDDVGKKVKIFTSDGQKADISDIKADSVIDVMKNEDLIQIIISDEVIYDYKIASIDDSDGLVISDKESEYTVLKDFTNSSSYSRPQTGKMYDIYINSFGKVAYILDIGNDGMKIAYLQKFVLNTLGADDTVYAKLIVGDKTAATYALDDKITFSNNDGKIENKKIDPINGFYTYLDGVKNQVIRYSVNGDNEITVVELALKKGVEPKTDNRLYVMAECDGDESDYTYFYANGTLGRKVYMEKTTPILVVPLGTTDASKFRIVSYESLTKGSRKMTAYGVNYGSPLASYVLYFDEASAAYNTGTEYVVLNVREELNENDELVTSVNVSRRGVNSTFYITEDSDLAKGILPISLAVKTTTQGIEAGDYLQLGKGDIISCTTDTAGNITSAAVIFDADGHYNAKQYKERWEKSSGYSADKFTNFDYDFTYSESGILAGTIGYYNQYVSNTNPFSTDFKNGPVYVGKNSAYGWHMGAKRFYLGYVYSVTDDYVTVTTKNLRELGGTMPEEVFGEDFLNETYVVDRYWNYADISGKTVTAGLVSDNPDCIKSYKEYGSKCSRVLICSGSTAVNEVYVINGNK